MKRLTLVFTLFVLSAPLWAEDSRTSLGVAAGSETGVGLSYRTETGPWGFQLTALPILGSAGNWISVGAKGLYTVHETEWTRFYGWAGSALFVVYGSFWVGTGGGYGLELIAFDHILVDLEAGLGVDLNAGRPSAGLRVQGGLLYRL